MSHKVETKTHSGVEFSNSSQCNRCKNCPCNTNKTEHIVSAISQKISDSYCSFYSSPDRINMITQIKENKNLCPGDEQEAMVSLVQMNGHELGKSYNT